MILESKKIIIQIILGIPLPSQYQEFKVEAKKIMKGC